MSWVLVNFSLSDWDIPYNATIESAQLCFSWLTGPTPGDAMYLSVARPENYKSPGSLTWNTRGQLGNLYTVENDRLLRESERPCFDVTSAVQYWANGGDKNGLVIMERLQRNVSASFYSREYSSFLYRPRFIIEYH